MCSFLLPFPSQALLQEHLTSENPPRTGELTANPLSGGGGTWALHETVKRASFRSRGLSYSALITVSI